MAAVENRLRRCNSEENPITGEEYENNRRLIVFVLPRRNEEAQQVYECLTIDDVHRILNMAERNGINFQLSISRYSFTPQNIRRNILERRRNTFSLRLTNEDNVYVLEDADRAEIFPAPIAEDTHDTWEAQAPPPIPQEWRDANAMGRAIRQNNIEIVRLLLNNGIQDNVSLVYAYQQNNVDIMRLLLEHGLMRHNMLYNAARDNNMPMTRLFAEYGARDDRALSEAARHNNLDMVELLVENDMRDDNALYFAFYNNNIDMIRLLIENGMRYNNALAAAINRNNIDIVRLCVENGMRYEMAATQAQQVGADPEIVRYLIEHGMR